jgi:hypothetical protein
MDGLKIVKPKEQQAGFSPIKVEQKSYPTLFFEKKTLNDFNSIIDNIETKIKEGLKKQKKDEKKMYKQQQQYGQQYGQQQQNQNNKDYNRDVDIQVGIPEEGRVKIKIKGYKGESLTNHFDKLVNILTELINNLNNKISELSDYNNYIQEKENLKLAKQLIEIRNKQQPNCSGEKYKTTWFFSSAFNTKLTDTNSSIINQQIQKDIEKCMDYLLSIIVEYCNKTGIMSPEASSYVQLNKEILYTVEQTRSQRLKAIQNRRQSGGKTKKLKSKSKTKSNKHITRKHKKY